MLIPIAKNPKQVNDPHYRYKRSEIETVFINKRGGMTKITNLKQICSQLKVPYLTFSKAFYRLVKKSGCGVVSEGVFKGRLENRLFEKVLQKMIVKFILCPSCSYPEWDLNNKSCNACGHQIVSGGSGDSKGSEADNEREDEEEEEVGLVENLTGGPSAQMPSGGGVDSNSLRLTTLMKNVYDERLKCGKEKRENIDKYLDLLWIVLEKDQPIKEKHIRCLESLIEN